MYTKPQIQEAQKTCSKINTKQSTPRHVTFELQKIHFKKNRIRITLETVRVRKDWSEMSKKEETH